MAALLAALNWRISRGPSTANQFRVNLRADLPERRPEMASKQQQAQGRETTDRVTLTSEARNMIDLEARLAAMPEVDLQRVAEIRTAIENGSYPVDAHAVADKLIAAQKELKG